MHAALADLLGRTEWGELGSLVIDRLYSELFEIDFQKAPFVANPNLDAARRDVDDEFGKLAPAVWPQWEAKLAARRGRLRS